MCLYPPYLEKQLGVFSIEMQKAFPHVIHVAPPEVDTIRSTNPGPIPLSSLLLHCKMFKMHGLPVRITEICGLSTLLILNNGDVYSDAQLFDNVLVISTRSRGFPSSLNLD